MVYSWFYSTSWSKHAKNNKNLQVVQLESSLVVQPHMQTRKNSTDGQLMHITLLISTTNSAHLFMRLYSRQIGTCVFISITFTHAVSGLSFLLTAECLCCERQLSYGFFLSVFYATLFSKFVKCRFGRQISPIATLSLKSFCSIRHMILVCLAKSFASLEEAGHRIECSITT